MNGHPGLPEMKVVIVGTSHVASESLTRVDSAIETYHPDVVGIELDRQRLHAMQQGLPSANFFQLWRRAGFFGAAFFTIGRILQQRIGTSLGLQPGTDMLHALERARSKEVSVALVDRDIRDTLKSLKRIPRKEKFRFVLDLIPGRSKVDDELANLDLSKVPGDEVVEKVLNHMRDRYPRFYHVLVEERNETIARNAERLLKHFETIVLVVGKAHATGIAEHLRAREIETIIA